MKYLSPRKLFWSFRVFIKEHWPKKTRNFVYVAIGDSTVEGIGASHPSRSYTSIIFSSIQQQYRNAHYYNLGKRGAPIRQVINEQLERAIALHPDLITISVGANDIRLHTKLSIFEKELVSLISRLQSETSAQIVINNIPDFSLTKAVPKRLKPIAKVLIQRFNSVIETVSEKAGVIYIDLHTQSRVYAKFYPEAVSEDEFHPSDFGYAIWANTIVTSIKHILYPKPRVGA